MNTWEYKLIEVPLKGSGVFASRKIDSPALTQMLNDHAQQGWELAETIPTLTNGWTDGFVAIFKRERPEQTAGAV